MGKPFHKKPSADQFLTAAEKLHVRFLGIAVWFTTVLLVFVPVSGIVVLRCAASKGLSWESAAAAVLFFCLYLAFQSALVWLCILCRRLRIAKRILVWIFLWVPVLNYFLAWYVRGLAKEEIDHIRYKIILNDVRAENQICAARYPFLLVHGIGFRDSRYFNYWGRIPRELAKNGAKVYYGNQEAWGTVEYNAQILKAQIDKIREETGCEKVNIIAHSKGGLDSRYMICALHMAPYVASLTTINTPHRGSMLVEFLKKLPDGVYCAICRAIDVYFGMFGDKNPDAYRASYQLSCACAKEFNRLFPDVEGIYYQSYASLMRSGFSSKLLCIPYWILKALDGPNDGLVTLESAKWGNFRGVLTNRRLRGISHADVIDLTREDYSGFDVLEFYVQLAKDLKDRGF